MATVSEDHQLLKCVLILKCYYCYRILIRMSSRWVNGKLEGMACEPIESLDTGFKTGIALANLIEACHHLCVSDIS